MEKNQFQELLQNFTSLTHEEVVELIHLHQQHPYSQVLQSMIARASHDHDLKNQDEFLHQSAIYSTDRSILKNIMSVPAQKRLPKAKPVEHGNLEELNQEVIESKIVVNLSGEKLLKEVEKDLAKLQKLKQKFETAVTKFEKMAPKPLEKSDVQTEKSDKKTKVKPKQDLTDGLIEEIKTSKRKIKPEDPKQKEQIEIIDQFIKTQPTIGKVKPVANAEPVDLAENSALFGENIISETLVEILLKQGKKEKALEVLKKLIWKFPQKKTYFAARIEELKK